ncbi:hypothetical protein A6U95_26780 [Serratia sp. 14-2641]|nr:hypothetical protein A6U95_26780 [Serratia sp. 14-2641]
MGIADVTKFWRVPAYNPKWRVQGLHQFNPVPFTLGKLISGNGEQDGIDTFAGHHGGEALSKICRQNIPISLRVWQRRVWQTAGFSICSRQAA